jgi:hypothetical protein
MGSESTDDEPSLRQKARAEKKFREIRESDNPFAEKATELRDEGMSYREIYNQYIEIEEALGRPSIAIESMLIPEWEVTVLVDAPDTPSGHRYKTYTRAGRDKSEVEDRVSEFSGWNIAPNKTEQVGYIRVS